jgi:hypothetical protein
MNDPGTWTAVGLTACALVLYEASLMLLQWRRPERLARVRHADMREDWFVAVSRQKGSEVLAVQALRNSMMSATMLASTAALALMGTITLVAPSLHSGVGPIQGASTLDARLVLELLLLALLCASLVSAVMAVRFYNHAGFIGGMPVDSETRIRWSKAGVRYVRRAGILYGIGLRQLVLVVPVVAAILLPAAGPFAAIGVVGVLYCFDRIGDDAAEA